MVYKFLNILRHGFALVFGREDPRRDRLNAMPMSAWQSISRPHILQGDIITIFPYEHRAVKDAIYCIKNARADNIAKVFAIYASDFLLEELSERAMIENFTNPLLVPVPTGGTKSHVRGFNPASILAEAIASTMSGFSVEQALIKVRETRPQKELRKHERLTNVSGSMRVRKSYTDTIRDRCVIVIDDVTTTGATLIEARRALLSGGARKVICVAMAH